MLIQGVTKMEKSLVLLLIISVTKLSMVQGCPLECYCFDSFASCTDFKTLDLTFLPRRTDTLVLSRGQLEELPPALLVRATSLKMVEMSSVHARVVRGGAFRGVRNLDMFSISNCTFDIVEPDGFSGLTNVRKILISETRFGRIGRHAFGEISGVKEFKLWSNSFDTFSDQAFNKLENIIAFQMYNNNVTYMGHDVFIGASDVYSVTLYRNFVKSASEGSFDNLANSTQLMVMDSNVFECTCDIAWMLESPSLKQYLSDNKCVYPGTRPYSDKSFILSNLHREALCQDLQGEPSTKNSMQPSILNIDEVLIPHFNEYNFDMGSGASVAIDFDDFLSSDIDPETSYLETAAPQIPHQSKISSLSTPRPSVERNDLRSSYNSQSSGSKSSYYFLTAKPQIPRQSNIHPSATTPRPSAKRNNFRSSYHSQNSGSKSSYYFLTAKPQLARQSNIHPSATTPRPTAKRNNLGRSSYHLLGSDSKYSRSRASFMKPLSPPSSKSTLPVSSTGSILADTVGAVSAFERPFIVSVLVSTSQRQPLSPSVTSSPTSSSSSTSSTSKLQSTSKPSSSSKSSTPSSTRQRTSQTNKSSISRVEPRPSTNVESHKPPSTSSPSTSSPSQSSTSKSTTSETFGIFVATGTVEGSIVSSSSSSSLLPSSRPKASSSVSFGESIINKETTKDDVISTSSSQFAAITDTEKTNNSAMSSSSLQDITETDTTSETELFSSTQHDVIDINSIELKGRLFTVHSQNINVEIDKTIDLTSASSQTDKQEATSDMLVSSTKHSVIALEVFDDTTRSPLSSSNVKPVKDFEIAKSKSSPRSPKDKWVVHTGKISPEPNESKVPEVRIGSVRNNNKQDKYAKAYGASAIEMEVTTEENSSSTNLRSYFVNIFVMSIVPSVLYNIIR